MKLQNLFLMLLATAVLFSCKKDDGTEEPNTIPEIDDQTTSVSEGMGAGTSFYTVTAEDEDGDTLTFSISENDNDLFTISIAGQLSVADGQSLDASNSPHSITVSVTDQKDTSSATVTINVTDEVEVTNQAPVMENQEFSVDEDVADDFSIATVIAADEDSETLTFSITTNSDDLFAITEDGILSITDATELDAWEDEFHEIVVSVSDDENTVDATITINVNDTSSFITTWKTDTAGETISFGDLQDEFYECNIIWGDENDDSYDTYGGTTPPSHVYEAAGTYTVKIRYGFSRLLMDNNPSATKLLSIDQWGAIEWQSFERAFEGCSNMVYNATDAPDLTGVADMSHMFDDATLFNGDISDWDVSSVSDMEWMFDQAVNFNADISDWTVSGVTKMSGMFSGASEFNQDLSDWDFSQVTDMSLMFNGATLFNQYLGSWDISAVNLMSNMLDNSGLSPENYDATLTGWANNANTPNNVTFGASGVYYCNGGMARATLEGKGWTIDDEGLDPICD
ncbi:BspA family leucine-rich repeat surface protein [Flagellimonas algicola]|uniref:BspA family leucine-rich repeat surface protein n=1 Tax=Flagellimonas algicola TaxID=2583815 RepID=A0ABY2WPA5_9FLAO|nr:BspA family leucine-rich repeat surface protein [Allomuricauda algicola]TMU56819.1 BspA family leucine-rich repeat surface protein [Allomuricauda algicola]